MENRKPLEEIYKPHFFKIHTRLAWRAEHVCRAIMEEFNPTTLMDVGCAVGDLVDHFRKKWEIVAWGLEGSKHASQFAMTRFIVYMDLRSPIDVQNMFPGRFDLCTCFEVLEHIEEEYSDILLDNLIAFSDKLLLSAAPPGQGGHYHVNCQPAEYWIEKFHYKSYEFNSNPVDRIRRAWEPWKKKPGIKAFYDNLLYFQKRRYS